MMKKLLSKIELNVAINTLRLLEFISYMTIRIRSNSDSNTAFRQRKNNSKHIMIYNHGRNISLSCNNFDETWCDALVP